ALREVLRYRDVRRVTVLDQDPMLFQLAEQDPKLSALNERAFADPRVRRVTGDAFGWLRGWPRDGSDGSDGDDGSDGRTAGVEAPYDVVLAGLPDPRLTASTKLYSLEFYGLLPRALAPGGRFAVHAGALRADPHTFWTVDA